MTAHIRSDVEILTASAHFFVSLTESRGEGIRQAASSRGGRGAATASRAG